MSLKSELIPEFAKCANDPAYFIRTYVKISHPTKGLVPFDLYDYQFGLLEDFEWDRLNVVLNARQMGVTSLEMAYVLWKLLFHPHYNVGLIVNKLTHGYEQMAILRGMFDTLPDWLKLDVDACNKTAFELSNGSRVRVWACNGNATRGCSLNMVIWSEAAYVSNPDAHAFWDSIMPHLVGNSQFIISSSVGTRNTFFQNLCEAAADKTHAFNLIKLPWNKNKTRGPEFEEMTKASIGQKYWDMEYECIFPPRT